ncbi:MAG TPA: hypothetical protein DEA96_04290 [Leptospiraceae bacterium]|nr:hypothetical protein [Leptospiraceae bacterium]
MISGSITPVVFRTTCFFSYFLRIRPVRKTAGSPCFMRELRNIMNPIKPQKKSSTAPASFTFIGAQIRRAIPVTARIPTIAYTQIGGPAEKFSRTGATSP